MKILMVCLGNICRSPLAEGILKHKLTEQGLAWEVDSAGTGAWHVGEKPDPRSIAVAQKHGINITTQRARQFTSKDLEDFDLIFAMDHSNLQNILRLAQTPQQEQKVRMIMELVPPHDSQDVPDPYWDNDGFQQVFDMLDNASEHLIQTYQ